MEGNEEKRAKRKVRKAKPVIDVHINEEPKVEERKQEEETKPIIKKKEEKEEVAKLEFAPPNSIKIIEIRNDGIAYLRDAKYRGKGYCLVDEVTNRTYMVTTARDKHPPFFYYPHEIATTWLSKQFLKLAEMFGLKTVMCPTLLYLSNNLKPVKVQDGDEPYILDWKAAKADKVSGIDWLESLETAKMADILAQRQNAGLSNVFMYLLLGMIVIGIVAIIWMLMGG